MRQLIVIIHLLVFLFQPIISKAQGWIEVVDSLEKVVASNANDTFMVMAMYDLAREYSFKDHDKALDYGNRSLALARKLNWRKGEAFANYNLGFVHRAQSDFEKTKEFHLKTLEIFKELNNKIGIAKVYNELGYLEYLKNNFNESIAFLRKAAEQEKEIGNSKRHYRILGSIGNIFFEQSNFSAALEVHEQALHAQEMNRDTNSMGHSLVAIGDIHIKMEDYKSSKKYLKKAVSFPTNAENLAFMCNAYKTLGDIARVESFPDSALMYYQDYVLPIFETRKNPRQTAPIVQKIGELHLDNQDFADAHASFTRALSLYEKAVNEIGIGRSKIALSKYHQSVGNNEKSIQLAKNALDIGIKKENLEIQKDALQNLAIVYEKINNPDKALLYYKHFNLIQDSIVSEKKIKEVAQIEMKYSFAKQQMADSLAYEQEKKILKTTVENERKARLLTVGLLGLSALFLIGLLWAYRRNKKRNNLLRGGVKNNLPNFAKLFFTDVKSALESLDKAKNAGIAGLWRVFLTKYKGKRTSKNGRLFIANSLNKKNILIETKNAENELLLKEIHHRVKNNLETVSSLLVLQSAHVQDPTVLNAMQESQNRVRSMGIIHQKLYQGENLAAVEMKDYFINLSEGILDSFGAEGRIQVECAMEELELDVDTAVPIGLIVNKLLTNALKYAFPDEKSGAIKISLEEKENEQLELTIADNGIGKNNADKNKGTGFGGQLVQLLTTQIGGKMEEKISGGTIVSLQFKKAKAA